MVVTHVNEQFITNGLYTCKKSTCKWICLHQPGSFKTVPDFLSFDGLRRIDCKVSGWWFQPL